jgi:FkbM family methyltransferase
MDIRRSVARLLSPQIILSLIYIRNLFHRDAFRRNQTLRREWRWHLLRRQSIRSGQFLRCALHDEMALFDIPQGSAISKSVFLQGSWEEPETQFLKKFVKSNMVVFDIGANIGAHTLLLSKLVGTTGQVHAFEPSRAFELLQYNVTENRIDNVVCNRLAVGDKEGTLTLNEMLPGLETFTSIGTPVFKGGMSGTQFSVAMTSLDAYCETHHIQQIDLIKIDIEGAEILALQGAIHILKQHLVKAWLFELNSRILRSLNHTPGDMLDIFQAAGYELFMLDDQGEARLFNVDDLSGKRDNIAILPDARRLLGV